MYSELSARTARGFVAIVVGTLKVDGKVVDTKKVAKTMPMILQWDEGFDIGSPSKPTQSAPK